MSSSVLPARGAKPSLSTAEIDILTEPGVPCLLVTQHQWPRGAATCQQEGWAL